jgi:low affinity Fe/Cu permease
MADQRRRRRPAALSAFNAAFPLGLGGTALFSLLFRDEGLLEDLTLFEVLISVGVVLVLWLVFWALIAASRRGSSYVGASELATPDARFAALLRDYHRLYDTIDEILRDDSDLPDDEVEALNEVDRRAGKAYCEWIEDAGARVREWPVSLPASVTPDAKFEALLRDCHRLYDIIDEILREAEDDPEMPRDEVQALDEVHRHIGKAYFDWIKEERRRDEAAARTVENDA